MLYFRVVGHQYVKPQLEVEDDSNEDIDLYKAITTKAITFIQEDINFLQKAYLSDKNKKFLLGNERESTHTLISPHKMISYLLFIHLSFLTGFSLFYTTYLKKELFKLIIET